LRDLLKEASDGVTRESVARMENLRKGTPLCDISVAITDAQRWVDALLQELK